ncbi:MAG: TolC family protein, partial [Opitutales bacterium]|nr:TolC family protein [Opitutales bacterium]
MMRLITILSVFAISLPGFASVPLDLPQAIEMALANNPDVRIAAEQVAASEALLEQSKSAFRPQIGLQSSY